jgi:hypothetical protein
MTYPEEVSEYKLRAELVSSGKATKIVSHWFQSRTGVTFRQSANHSAMHRKRFRCRKPSRRNQSSKSSNGKGKAVEWQIDPDALEARDAEKAGANHLPKQICANKQKGSRKLHGLPRPTFDQLEGGRTGKKKEEKKGLVGFIKKLFS